MQLQKRRLMSESDDKKTDRDKLFAEQRAIKDTIRGPSNLQVSHGKGLCALGCSFCSPAAAVLKVADPAAAAAGVR
jgi:hypothetical protein